LSPLDLTSAAAVDELGSFGAGELSDLSDVAVGSGSFAADDSSSDFGSAGLGSAGLGLFCAFGLSGAEPSPEGVEGFAFSAGFALSAGLGSSGLAFGMGAGWPGFGSGTFGGSGSVGGFDGIGTPAGWDSGRPAMGTPGALGGTGSSRASDVPA
jgi:hypothetical protein